MSDFLEELITPLEDLRYFSILDSDLRLLLFLLADLFTDFEADKTLLEARLY